MSWSNGRPDVRGLEDVLDVATALPKVSCEPLTRGEANVDTAMADLPCGTSSKGTNWAAA